MLSIRHLFSPGNSAKNCSARLEKEEVVAGNRKMKKNKWLQGQEVEIRERYKYVGTSINNGMKSDINTDFCVGRVSSIVSTFGNCPTFMWMGPLRHFFTLSYASI